MSRVTHTGNWIHKGPVKENTPTILHHVNFLSPPPVSLGDIATKTWAAAMTVSHLEACMLVYMSASFPCDTTHPPTNWLQTQQCQKQTPIQNFAPRNMFLAAADDRLLYFTCINWKSPIGRPNCWRSCT